MRLPVWPLLAALAACAPATSAPAPPVDADGDGFASSEDCDDANARVHPNAYEVCDGIDNDCDGRIDDDALDATRWYRDGDGDGWGDSTMTATSCVAPKGWVVDGGDCDDLAPDVYPGADGSPCVQTGDDHVVTWPPARR